MGRAFIDHRARVKRPSEVVTRRALPILLSFFFAVSCGGSTGTVPATSEKGSGSANFTVTSSQPAPRNSAEASFYVTVSFTPPSSCTSTVLGACTVNPCSTSSGNGASALPSAGQVTFVGTAAAPLALEPQLDGNYAGESVVGQVPWQTVGDAVTFQWAHFPGDAAAAGDEVTLATPPYIALAAGSAFADATTTVVRAQDLTISWTSDAPPAATDEVVLDVKSGAMGVYCIFNAGVGEGVMPTAILEALDAGGGTYSVISKEHAYEDINARDGDGAWVMNFNVNALARTSYGLASGSVTIQ